ncbi:Spy/CpxP family protein refolding chaperone [Massilia forsythiae]|uniref:Spy/CpxP family protein refolding chaperone n=1 Tax=Massilia forsythiae TaxID=2728020 RepID=A0A7Z2W0L6_9BURK|nr:Spy/CpxP family protein refolding chaperone [Massilia forsythiae]QJE02565.1 Spy/CpxP family protein refolding chaperone [Massilia forsythiae]
MKFTRQSVAAALFAAGAAACFANPACAFATADAAAPAAGSTAAMEHAPGGDAGARPERGVDERGPDGHGPDRRGHGEGGGPDGGPDEGFGGHGPGAPGPDMPFGHGGPSGMHGLHRLQLSEAQQDKLFAVMHAAAPQRREQDKAERKAREALREMGQSGSFDETRASNLARNLGQAIAAGIVLQARTHAQVLAVLTAEQREQLRKERPPGPPPGR